MIIIQTRTWLAGYKGNPIYKDYKADCGVKAAMQAIRDDMNIHDLAKYEPIEIYNVIDTDEL